MSLNRQFRPAVAVPIAKDVPKPVAPPKPAVAAASEPRAKRGPKPSGNAKVLLTLRLDQAVVAKFEATGPGWRTRMNDALAVAKL